MSKEILEMLEKRIERTIKKIDDLKERMIKENDSIYAQDIFEFAVRQHEIKEIYNDIKILEKESK